MRRGHLCPGYRREIKWSTISTLTGKTRPPVVESSRLAKKQDVTFELPAAEAAPSQLQEDEFQFEQHGDLNGGQDYVFDPSAVSYTEMNDGLDHVTPDTDPFASTSVLDQTQNGLDLEDDASHIFGPESEWPEWSMNADMFVPAFDDNADRLGDTSAEFNVVPADLMGSPRKQADDKALALAHPAGTVSFPSPNPVDLSTTLVEYWFTHVCSMWCAFDSPQNWYRNLANDSWHHSEPVYYALQAMSASVLVDSLPHLKQALPTLTAKAARAIQRAIEADAAREDPMSLPNDLLLAVMGMGTSMSWADPRQLGFWFLDKARGLINQYSGGGELLLDESSKQTLDYFRQALVYWEMLANVVTKDYQNILRSRRAKFKKRIWRAMSMDETGQHSSYTPSIGPKRIPRSIGDSAPHPWTGISSDIQQTFGLVMGLCQNRCVARSSDSDLTADSLCDALCDIELARDLEKDLLGFDFSADQKPSFTTETGDPNAPLSHLVDTAEAYRLAALLNLYLAFSDLEVKLPRAFASHETSADDEKPTTSWTAAPASTPRSQALVTLTLHLISVLKRVPADSGTRCIQPILLISAAAGLRFDVPIPPQSTTTANSSLQPIHAHGTLINQAALPLLHPSLHPSVAADPIPQLTTLTLDVSAARRFIVTRLGALQQSLPPRPIGVALALVRAVWLNYDAADERLRARHWMGTMVESGLRTLFG